MYTFKFDDNYFTAYGSKEIGNPHSKKYPCVMNLSTEKIAENQRSIIKGFLSHNNLDYHEVIPYDEKDINTHDLVNALLKFHTLRKI